MKNTYKFYAGLITIALGFSLISTVSADDFDYFLQTTVTLVITAFTKMMEVW